MLIESINHWLNDRLEYGLQRGKGDGLYAGTGLLFGQEQTLTQGAQGREAWVCKRHNYQSWGN